MGAVDLGRVYRPHYVRSVLTALVKILPYRPSARLMRAKCGTLRLQANELVWQIAFLEQCVLRKQFIVKKN